MMPQLSWLPNLVLFRDYGGDWDTYLTVIYGFFKQDFVDRKPFYEGRKVGLKRHPVSAGKEATFWHLISTGDREEERIPDFRRCERIRWPRPIIDHHADSVVKVWKNKRGREMRICFWLEDHDFLVVLAERKRYLLLWTAYPVEWPHTRRKLQKEFEAYWQGLV